MPADEIPVVVAAPPMHVGGTEQHLLHVLPQLRQRGFAVSVALLQGGGALEERLRAGVADVSAPPFSMPRPFRTIAQALSIRSAVRRTGARVVHAFLSEPYIAAAVAQRMMWGDRPALVHGRRSLAFYIERHRIARRIEIASHALSSALVGNSQAVVRELVAEAGDASKVCLISNGIPLGESIQPAERMEARARFELPQDAFVMTMVANLHPYKGHADVLAALAIVRERLPQPWRVLLVGRDAGVGADVHATIAGSDFAANVCWAGEWPGSRTPYAAADVGLLPSHTEGFSNSLIEGMAAGLPMIATRVGGNIDAIEDGLNGFLVAPKAPDELASAMLTLAQMPDLRARLGAAARRKAVARFSLEACVDRYETLWRGLSEGRAGAPHDWLSDAPKVTA